MSDALDRLRAGLADRYRIERELGRGGMATVYLAEDLKHHRLVALKVLRPDLTAALGPERFLREIEVASHLRHPHILPLFDSGRIGDGGGGLFYYVMPYVEGESLRHRIERERQLPLEDAIGIARDVADALDAAHSQGVIHRDIKPENILLERGHAVVADFGIARALSAAGQERLTETGFALGTPQYMSPEQATGSGDLDPRADVYSLGCVVYEMLAGTPPFTGATAQAVMARHSVEAVAPLRTVRSSVPEAVERVVLRALAKVPADRWPAAGQFADALAKASSSPSMEAAQAPGPRSRVIWLLPAAVLAGLIGLSWAVLRVANRPEAAEAAAAEAGGRVAVLSFTNLAADTADKYLARGLSEEIAARLDDFPELKVAGRSAVERLEREDTAGTLARARSLGFGQLVEGSVLRSGQRLRVSVRLVNASDGLRRWARRYDRAATDLLALQEEIALDVARAVAGQLLSPTSRPDRGEGVASPAAYDQLLRGNYYLAQRNPRALARAVEAYAGATRLDSGYALAYAKLAHAHVLLLDWGWTYDGLPPESLLARGSKAAEQAVRLAPALPDGWLAQGSLLRFRNPRTLAGVREAFQSALALDPANAEAHHEFGMNLRLLDDPVGAAAEFQRALSIEPDRPMSLVHLGWIAMERGRYSEARHWFDSAAAVNPGFYQAYAERSALRLLTGDTAGARADAETAVRLRPPSDLLTAEDVLLALERLSGDTAGARARLARLRTAAPDPGDPGVHRAAAWAAVLVAAGEHREAIDFLERTRVAPGHLRIHLDERRFDPVRGDPRFQRLIESMRVRVAR